MKEFMKLCGLKINYGKLFNNVRSTAHKCALLRRILVQKGMDGEPTMAKCKKLKLEMQAKRESAELDKSVILATEGVNKQSLFIYDNNFLLKLFRSHEEITKRCCVKGQ